MRFLPQRQTECHHSANQPSSTASAAGSERPNKRVKDGDKCGKIIQKLHVGDCSLVEMSNLNKSYRKACVPKTRPNQT